MKQVVILTTGRSGSSMLTNILIELGVYMGDDFQEPDWANPYGYFDDGEFVSLSEELIDAWASPQPVDFEKIYDRMAALVYERDSQHEIWGWKDRQTLQTIQVWNRYLSNPQYIYMARDLASVVASYSRMGGRMNGAVIHWRDMIEKYLAKKDHLRLDYDELCRTRDIEVIARFLGVSPTESARAVIKPKEGVK